MLQYYFKVYFIFMLYLIIFAKEKTFNKQKCESLFSNCICNRLRSYTEVLVDIRCTNITDFSNISQILDSGDIFDANTVYGITFRGIKSLPARILRGLNISKLNLDAPDVTVDENVLEGITYLRQCYVKRSSIKDIPDFSIVKDSIKKILIDSSRLTSLEGKNLQNLTRVEMLSFSNNSIRFIDPDVFKGTENVLILDLSHNLLTSIPPKLLDPMKNLSSFYASYNNLLHVDNLFSVTRPYAIFLDFNNITDVDSVLHFNMERVEILSLTGNPIKKISNNSFRGKIPNVGYLYLDHCGLQEFSWIPFGSLPKLGLLDLSYNLIEDVNNPSPSNVRYPVGMKFRTVYFYLRGNKLQSLTDILRNMDIKDLKVPQNEIKYLTDEDFNYANTIRRIELQENKIQRLDSKTFTPLKRELYYLDLSSNLIQSLNRSVRYLSRLQQLKLGHNSIQSFAKDEFQGLNELKVLHLQHNQIKDLRQIPNLPRLQHLLINNNDIAFIEPDHLPKNLRWLHLAGNPLKCDCRLQTLIHSLDARNTLVTGIDICSQSDFVDSLYCPGMCSCSCTSSGNVPFLSVDCSSKNISILPQFLKNTFKEVEDNLTATSDYQSSLVMDQNIHPSLQIEDRALGINLENNNLESLEGVELHPNIIQLYLANNKLRRLPEFIFDNLRNLNKVSLSGNPWDCDCNALKFKKWLIFNYAIIQDLKNIRCGVSAKKGSSLNGRVIWKLTDLDICPSNKECVFSAIICVLILLIFCLATKILYRKYELNVKSFFYFHGFSFVKEKELDDDKIFDAFFSFSDMDSEFLTKNIISVIEEKDPNVRLCIPYRDFGVGSIIHDNIMHAVRNSKKTVLFLSRNFLESEWCLMEFQAAHVQALKDKVHRIIVVKFGDIPMKIDPQIQVYLDSTTYLTWGEKYFWYKLFFALPSSSKIKNTVLMTEEDNGIV